MSPRCGFPDVVSQLPPRFLRLLSSCLPLVSQMWSQNCLPIAFHNSDLSPSIGFPMPPSVFHLSPCCFPVVFQMLSPTCRLVVSGLSCKCGLPIVSQFVPDVLSRFSLSCLPLNPTTPSCLPDLVPQWFLNCFPLVLSCLPDVVFQLSSNCIL